jgi:hypothetical protein
MKSAIRSLPLVAALLAASSSFSNVIEYKRCPDVTTEVPAAPRSSSSSVRPSRITGIRKAQRAAQKRRNQLRSGR